MLHKGSFHYFSKSALAVQSFKNGENSSVTVCFSFAISRNTFLQIFKSNSQTLKEEKDSEGFILESWSEYCIFV